MPCDADGVSGPVEKQADHDGQTRPSRLICAGKGALACLIFVLLALGVLAAWSGSDRHPLTGDEPNYLVMADGLVRNGSFEQTQAYSQEFQDRRFFAGWPAAGTPVSPQNAQVVHGPHGLYNIHNVGLPALIAGPLAIAGVAGARAVLVLWACSVVALGVVSAGHAPQRPWRPAIVAICLVCSLPFLTAAGQIYPDIGAGALFLAGSIALLRARQRPALLWVTVICAALLPWLQIKDGLLTVLLVLAAVVRARQEPGRWRYLPGLVPVLGGVALLSYNTYAYGAASGPYGDGALDPGLRALQTAVGLVLDQNHGLLFQNPLLLISGLAGLGNLWLRDRLTASTVAAGAALMLSLNALHPNWYGGTSFAGRFMWTSAAILVLPAVLRLVDLWHRRPVLTRWLLGASITFQSLLLLRATLPAGSAPTMYNKPAGSLIVGYGNLLPLVERWLPALHDPAWAWQYLPNWLWIGAFLLLAMVAAVVGPRRRQRALLVAGILSATVVVGGPMAVDAPEQARTLVFQAASLPSLTGRIQDRARTAVPGQDRPGFLVYGPGAGLPTGSYVATFTVTSTASESTVVAIADVLYGPEGTQQSAPVEVRGSRGAISEVIIRFSLADGVPQHVQTRMYWRGTAPLVLRTARVTVN